MLDDLRDAAFEGVYNLEVPWHPAHARFEEMRTLILPSLPGSRYLLRVREFMRHGDELADLLEHHDMGRRIVRAAAASVADGHAAAARLREHSRRFDLLLARANRVRNATLHGNDVAVSVADSVDFFVARLAGTIITGQLDALRDAEAVAAVLGRYREQNVEALARLDSGGAPADVLWTETDD